MQTEIPLRELKKARTKVALYEAFLALMGDNIFRDVMLDDICRKAEVSRVTFFKFFQRKEDLLIYFMRVWLTERLIEIETRGCAVLRPSGICFIRWRSKAQPGPALCRA
ncbi:TetR/AcrR family transcriptional regulator [Paenibacillus sp. P26]|nr:TetR/AcrR family transcriptional regulator [Paenibacillus sp. P26]